MTCFKMSLKHLYDTSPLGTVLMKHCFSFLCWTQIPLSAKASGPQLKTAWQQGCIEIVSRFGKWKWVSKLSRLPPCLLFPFFELLARESSARLARSKSGQSSAVSPLMPVLHKCMECNLPNLIYFFLPLCPLLNQFYFPLKHLPVVFYYNKF